MASTPAKKNTHTEKTGGEKAARRKVGQTNINKTADEKVPYLLDWIYSGGGGGGGVSENENVI